MVQLFAEYNDILSVADVCEILLIGRNSVYDLLNQGLRIPVTALFCNRN